MPLYHYTSRTKLKAILSSGVIKPSHEDGPRGRDAVLGIGVYFTELPPETRTEKILQNNYGQVRDSDFDRTNAYIEIPRKCLKDAYCENLPGGRKVFIVPTEDGVYLDNIPYKYGDRDH